MKISYYTIDDIRLGHDPKGVTGWRIRHFLNLDKALAQYRQPHCPEQGAVCGHLRRCQHRPC